MDSPELRERIRSAKVLAVGAGGIGCELLKTLVLTGFEDIETIDMDTIETTNLNRQFLFRKHHVGESKAKIASEAVLAMRPKTKITHYHANVKERCGDVEFNVGFFRRFDLVLNGLDNLDARRHVNRLCLAAEVPLVESGTAGHLGQVTVHRKGHTQCFECEPKPTPKTYPVCTIRNTPDKMIHCIVWAKDLLFNRLFGRADGPTDLDEGQGEDDDGVPEEDDVATFFQVQEGEAPGAFASRIFSRVFTHDIDRVLRMDDLWKTRTRPSPLDVTALCPEGPKGAGKASPPPASASKMLGLRDSHKVWEAGESARVFLESARLFLETRASEVGEAVFDKDDALAVDLVVAAANLRAINYGIPTISLFEAKGMAGNIVHAVATTNAIVSGLIVIEACKLLAQKYDKSRMTFVKEFPTGKRLLQPLEPEKPNPKCYVCSKSRMYLHCDTAATTLGTVLEKVIKGRMGINCPEVSFSSAKGDFMYEEGAGLEDDEVEMNARHAAKPLADLPAGGVKNDTMLSVEDFSQALRCELMVCHVPGLDGESGWKLEGDLPTKEDAEGGGGAAEGAGGDDDDDDDDAVVVEAPGAAGGGGGGKRGRDEGAEGGERGGKRARSAGGEVEVVEL